MSVHLSCINKQALELAWALIRNTIGPSVLDEKQEVYGVPLIYEKITKHLDGTRCAVYKFWLGGKKRGCVVTFSESLLLHQPMSTMKCKAGAVETVYTLPDEIFEQLKTTFHSIPLFPERKIMK